MPTSEHYREVYHKLSRIGVTKKELTRMYASVQRWIFLTPLYFGTFLSLAYIYMTTYLLGGHDTIVTFVIYTLISALVYGFCQMTYYFMTIKRFTQSILR